MTPLRKYDHSRESSAFRIFMIFMGFIVLFLYVCKYTLKII